MNERLGEGCVTSTVEVWNDYDARTTERHATQQTREGHTLLPPNLSLGGLVCGHKALMLLGQELETVVAEYALSDPSGIWLLQYA